MSDSIAHLIGLLMRWLLPRRGADGLLPTAPLGPRPIRCQSTSQPARPRFSPLRGEDSRLVRPYLLAHEERGAEVETCLISSMGVAW
ncbi:hypothetical protein ABZ990_17620 [Streptomyces sp. NPDC046203]|uniref:hypothetical protein n=1 Tax=Streptomyces sp. NPDC046203 TaxID=3154602 RepID=UPI0033E83702